MDLRDLDKLLAYYTKVNISCKYFYHSDLMTNTKYMFEITEFDHVLIIFLFYILCYFPLKHTDLHNLFFQILLAIFALTFIQ